MRRTQKPFSPLPSLSLTRVLFTRHFHRGKNQAVPFSQGSAFLLFNTVHVFSISVERRLSDLPKPSESRCLCVSEDIKKHTSNSGNGVSETGAAVPGKHQEGGLHLDGAEDRLPYFISREGYIELNFGAALERHQNYSSPSVNAGGGAWGAVTDWV